MENRSIAKQSSSTGYSRPRLIQMDDTNNNGKGEKKSESAKSAGNASRTMHKILNATAFFSARENRDGKSDSVNEHARLYAYTFLITAHLYVDKGGLAA